MQDSEFSPAIIESHMSQEFQFKDALINAILALSERGSRKV
jgi:hypothetical protein